MKDDLIILHYVRIFEEQLKLMIFIQAEVGPSRFRYLRLSSILNNPGYHSLSIVYLDKITQMALNGDFRFPIYTRTNTNLINRAPMKYIDIYQVCFQMLLIRSSIMSNYRYCNHSNTTNAASRTGTAYLRRVHLRFLLS